MHPTSFIESAWRDVRYAGRMIRKYPLFALSVVLTMAVAIAINTAVFSVADAVLLRPLPYPQPDRLALVSTTIRAEGGEFTDTAQTGRTWELVRDRATSVDRAVFSSWSSGVNLIAQGRASYVPQQRVGAGFFDVLGVAPAIGRGFSLEEDRVGGPDAAVLSNRLWHSAFNGEPSVLGRQISIQGKPHTVVGVMPAGFASGTRADLWTPLRATTEGEGGGENFGIVTRLKAGVSWPQAEGEARAIGEEIVRQETDGRARAKTFSLMPLQQALTEGLRRPILILWAAVALVLIVASVNLAGLLLSRVSIRRREIATRMALGSGRAAVVRQLLVENLVLAALGAVAGLLLGFLALDALAALARDGYEIWQTVALDARAMAVGVGLALVSGAAFGLVPALHASRVDIQAGLAEGGRGATAGSRWPRRLLVVAQVAMGVVLLSGAGLLVRTFEHLHALEPGFDPRNLVAATVSLQDARYPTAAQVSQLFDDTLSRLRGTPGIESAAVSLGLPYERLLNLGFRRADGASSNGMTNATYVTPDFFRTMRIPIPRGRAFEERDSATAAPVAIVSETLATTYFSGEEALGRHIRFAGAEREIVGIAGDVQVKPSFGEHGPLAPTPLAYIPARQASTGMLRLVHTWFSPVFVVRTSASDAPLALRRALDAVDPLLPFAEVRTMREIQGAAVAQQRFLMAILVVLALTAVLLAAIGIHGLVATSVTERTREMGVRIALGATTGRVMRTLALPGIGLAAAGVVIGGGAAAFCTRPLRSFLWGVTTADPVTFAAVAIVLLAVASAASILPALRILRLDPARTLRDG